MAIRGERRVEKLESALFGKLTPKERMRMVLTAAASGDAEQARRIGQACPKRSYRMTDADYLDWLEDGHNLCKAAIGHFQQHVFTYRMIESVKKSSCETVAGLIASYVSTLSVSAMLKDQDDDAVDWAQVEAAEEGGRKYASKVIARILDAKKSGLRRRIRVEWAGFDAVCREELGLDAWTLFKGYEVPKEFIAVFEGLLSADADEGSQEPDKAAVTEGLAFWRPVIQGWRENKS